jgi:hypothetical protein
MAVESGGMVEPVEDGFFSAIFGQQMPASRPSVPRHLRTVCAEAGGSTELQFLNCYAMFQPRSL